MNSKLTLITVWIILIGLFWNAQPLLGEEIIACPPPEGHKHNVNELLIEPAPAPPILDILEPLIGKRFELRDIRVENQEDRIRAILAKLDRYRTLPRQELDLLRQSLLGFGYRSFLLVFNYYKHYNKWPESLLHIDFVDGSRIIGIPSHQSMSVRTRYSSNSNDLLLKHISRISITHTGNDKRFIRVDMNNKDQLGCELVTDKLKCFTLIGIISLALDKRILSISNKLESAIYATEFQEKRYYLISHLTMWHEAKAISEHLGGHLLTFESREEEAFILRFCQEHKINQNIWLGLTDVAKEGDWRWVTGKRLSYRNWEKGEPNNTGHQEHYAHLRKGLMKWNDIHSNAKAVFIVELDKTEASK